MPVAFEVEAQALARALVKKGDKQPVMLVDFGRTRSGFTVVAGGVVQLTATVPVGGDTLVASLAAALKKSPEEARELKETIGLSHRAENPEIFSAILPTVSLLRDEINTHLTFWNTHKDDSGTVRKAVGAVIFCGGDANIPGLVEYLATGFDIPFTLANPWMNTVSFEERIPGLPLNQALRYSTAIGLAMRSYSEII